MMICSAIYAVASIYPKESSMKVLLSIFIIFVSLKKNVIRTNKKSIIQTA